MTFRQRLPAYRVGLGLALLLLFQLLSNVPLPGLVRDLWVQETRGPVDNVTAYERRFEKVKVELPARGVVGYRTQFQKRGGREVFTYQADRGMAELPAKDSYFLAQYAVAPVIVDFRRKRPVKIVNLANEVTFLREEGG